MATSFIKGVTAFVDAIDRLEWSVSISTGFYGNKPNQAFAFHWDGRVAFYREPLPSGVAAAPQIPRLSLDARWTNRDDTSRFNIPSDVAFVFATELPAGAIDRIEAFRESGRLYARVEGLLFLSYKWPHAYNSTQARPWLDDAFALVEDIGRTPCAVVRSEPFELREIWCSSILVKLRPPGRFVLDFQVPAGNASDEPATRAAAYLAEATDTFNNGRYGEVGRVCYRALEELQKVLDRVESRYGKYGKSRIGDQIKDTKSLCNPERHTEQEAHDDLAFDRVLAQHVLAVTSSLVGVMLQ